MIEKTNGGFLITQIKQIQGRIFEKLLAEAGISEFNGAQGRILYVLWERDSVPIVELARKTGLAKTTLTSMLDRLEKEHLLCRKADKRDRRKIYISLTEKAKGLRETYNLVSAKMNVLFYENFLDAEIQAFECQLKKILENLQETERKL